MSLISGEVKLGTTGLVTMASSMLGMTALEFGGFAVGVTLAPEIFIPAAIIAGAAGGGAYSWYATPRIDRYFGVDN